MKKIMIIMAIAMVLSFSASINSQAQTFKNGDLVANAGLGFGWYGYSYYGFAVSSLPAISLSLEKGIKEISGLNDGVLSIGGIAGIKHGSWSGYGYNGSYNDIIIAGRAAIHANLFEVDKLDTYAGAALGLRIHNENYPYSTYVNDNFTRPLFAIYAGGRYYFTERLAGFGEVGYGLGYITLGLSFKLK